MYKVYFTPGVLRPSFKGRAGGAGAMGEVADHEGADGEICPRSEQIL